MPEAPFKRPSTGEELINRLITAEFGLAILRCRTKRLLEAIDSGNQKKISRVAEEVKQFIEQTEKV